MKDDRDYLISKLREYHLRAHYFTHLVVDGDDNAPMVARADIGAAIDELARYRINEETEMLEFVARNPGYTVQEYRELFAQGAHRK